MRWLLAREPTARLVRADVLPDGGDDDSGRRVAAQAVSGIVGVAAHLPRSDALAVPATFSQEHFRCGIICTVLCLPGVVALGAHARYCAATI